MELGAGVRPAVDAFRQNRREIGHGFRRDLAEKSDLDSAQPVAGHIHVQVRHVGDRERLNDVLNANENVDLVTGEEERSVLRK